MTKRNIIKYGIVIILACIWGTSVAFIFPSEIYGKWINFTASVIGGGMIGAIIPMLLNLIYDRRDRKKIRETIYLKSERNDVH